MQRAVYRPTGEHGIIIKVEDGQALMVNDTSGHVIRDHVESFSFRKDPAGETTPPVTGPDDHPDKIPAWLSDDSVVRESWIDEAIRIVSGNRNHDYGDPEDNIGRTAKAWSAYLDREITTRDVCWMMVMLKALRDANRPKRDNPVDAHGYLLCMERSEK